MEYLGLVFVLLPKTRQISSVRASDSFAGIQSKRQRKTKVKEQRTVPARPPVLSLLPDTSWLAVKKRRL